MSKAADMAKVSARGGFHLMWGLASSTVITSVGVIILARLLSPSDFGIYSIALTIPNLVSLFRDWGTSYAVVKYTAKYNSENNLFKVKQIIFSGLFFQTILAICLTLITFFSSDFLASVLFDSSDLAYIIQVVSLSLLSGSFVSLVLTISGTSTSVAEAAFIGLEKTKFQSLTLLALSVIRTVVTSFLVIVGLGSFGAVLGFTFSMLLTGLVALLLLLIIIFKLPKISFSELKIVENLKFMFSYGFPLSLVTIFRGFLRQFYIIILAVFVSDALIGNYSVATNFVVLITFFSSPIRTMLFPAFSKLDPIKDKDDFKNVFRFSVKYGSLLVVPVTFLIICLSQPAIFTLFGNQYESAPLFLSLLAIPYLFSAFGFLSVTNLLNGQGKTRLNLKFALVTVLIGFSLGFLLVYYFEVEGLILASVIAEVPSVFVGLYWVKKNFGLKIDWVFSVKILLASGLASGLTLFFVAYFAFTSWVNLVFGSFIFVILLLFLFLLIRVVDKDDLSNLKNITAALGPFNKIFVFVFDFYEKLMNVLKLN